MLKFHNAQIVFREIPDEITLAINITNCPFSCPGCHSPYLRQDIGIPLDKSMIDSLILNHRGITCVCFMGASTTQEQYKEICVLRDYIKSQYGLKTAWYTGEDASTIFLKDNNTQWKQWDFIKYGSYVEVLGALDVETTNQKLVNVKSLI